MVLYLFCFILLESRGVAISSIKGHANDLCRLLASEHHPCCSQCSRNYQDSQANLGSKDNLLGFQRWVLRKLGFSAIHCEVFQKKKTKGSRRQSKYKAGTGEINRGQRNAKADGRIERECEVNGRIYSRKKVRNLSRPQ